MDKPSLETSDPPELPDIPEIPEVPEVPEEPEVTEVTSAPPYLDSSNDTDDSDSASSLDLDVIVEADSDSEVTVTSETIETTNEDIVPETQAESNNLAITDSQPHLVLPNETDDQDSVNSSDLDAYFEVDSASEATSVSETIETTKENIVLETQTESNNTAITDDRGPTADITQDRVIPESGEEFSTIDSIEKSSIVNHDIPQHQESEQDDLATAEALLGASKDNLEHSDNIKNVNEYQDIENEDLQLLPEVIQPNEEVQLDAEQSRDNELNDHEYLVDADSDPADAKIPINDLKNPSEVISEDFKPERPAYKKLDKAELPGLVQVAIENPARGSLERDKNPQRFYRYLEAFYGPCPAGYVRHHLIPVAVAKNEENRAMQTAEQLGYNINNPNNVIYLPNNASMAAQTGEPLHTKETSSYDWVVQAELDGVWARYEHRRAQAGSSLEMAEYLKTSDQQIAFLQDIQRVENSIREKLVSRGLFITETDPNYKSPSYSKKLDKKTWE